MLKVIPFGDWLAFNLFGYVDDPEVVTYDFVNELNSVVSQSRVKTNDLNGYLGVSIGQNIQQINIQWSKTTILSALAQVGAQALSLIAITKFLLSHYEEFSYHMDALKSLYFEQRQEEDSYEQDWRNDLTKKFKSREPFEFSYWSQCAAGLAGFFCCCFGERLKSCRWYKRQTDQIAKFNLARHKFNSEIDLKSILVTQRISKLIAKLKTTKRQRRSVSYFRSYTIGDKQVMIDNDEKAKMKRLSHS